MCQTLKDQKVCILEGPVRGKLFFIFAYPENVMCLGVWLKSLNFCGPFWGTYHFGTPKFCQILLFLYINLS